MSVTQYSAADIQEMVVKAWSDVFMQELREALLLGALVNKDYSGSLAQLGDEVSVSQINPHFPLFESTAVLPEPSFLN